ncbi:MAG: serine/threonine-protein kinase [Acidobacteriota bacterium]
MTPEEHWRKVKTILADALERPTSERESFLDTACGDDADLRSEIESLLEGNQHTNVLDYPLVHLVQADPQSAIGRRLGAYQLRRVIGSGGMGTVYLASREDDFAQEVVVKLLKRGMDTDEIIRRFRTERQILARLEHPNIARLIDGGSTEDGLPYFVLEYVDGEAIDEYCARHELNVTRRLELFLEVCDAVEYAHKRLIVHRDIKPSNILVTHSDGRPKLLDFGIAKLLGNDSEGMTVPRTIEGSRFFTPDYASPEQVVGDPVTTASDVYSLGVMLYELLTALRPYRIPTGSAKVIAAVLDQEPLRPSTAVTRVVPRGDGTSRMRASEVARPPIADNKRLKRQLQGDLDSIVLQAMHRDPNHRYGSSAQLAADVRRYLDGEPVQARRQSHWYRTSKFVRRNWAVVATAVLLFVLVIGFGLWQRHQFLYTQGLLTQVQYEKEVNARVVGFLEDTFQGADPDKLGRKATAEELLDHAAEQLDESSLEPDIHGALLHTIGGVNRFLGRDDKATDQLEEALEIRIFATGDDSVLTARTMIRLALALQQDDRDRAIDLTERAIEIFEAKETEEREIDLGLAYNNLGLFRAGQGRAVDAERLYRHALSIKETRLGSREGEIDYANTLSNLGLLVGKQGRHDEAIEYLFDAYQRRHHHHDEPSEIASTANALAATLQRANRQTEAVEFYEEALQTFARQNRSERLRVLNNLATLKHDLGELAAAETFYRQVVELTEDMLDPGSLPLALFRQNLASLLVERGALDEAEQLFTVAWDVVDAHYRDEPHPNVASVLINRASLALAKDKLDEARRLVSAAAERLAANESPPPYRVTESEALLALIDARLDPSSATSLERAIDGYHQLVDQLGDPRARRARNLAGRLEHLYRLRDETNEADTWKIRRDNLPTTDTTESTLRPLASSAPIPTAAESS